MVAMWTRWLADGLLVAILPSPERDRYARDREIDAPRWSFAVGLLQMAAGTFIWFRVGLAFIGAGTDDLTRVLLENWWPGLSTTHLQGVGLVNWLTWCLHPVSWPFAYLGLTGLLRCAAFGISREALGEPVVWAGMRLAQTTARRRREKRREADLGPVRPDRIREREQGGVWVLSCREKPEWNDLVTIEIGDRLFRLDGVEELREGSRVTIVYALRSEAPNAVIRRLVRYVPGSDPSQRKPSHRTADCDGSEL
jgi:hypothetical protein